MNAPVAAQAFQEDTGLSSDFQSLLAGMLARQRPRSSLVLDLHAWCGEEARHAPADQHADQYVDRDPCSAMTGYIVALRVTAKQATSSGKCYAVDDAGQVRTDIRHWTWFEPVVVGFDGLAGLHAAFESVASGDYGYASVVRGGLLPGGGRTIPRRKQAGRDKRGRMLPAGLRDAPLPWLVLDFDKVPNPHRYDPRDPGQGQQAIEWMLSLMPASMAGIGFSWAWSSSACLKDADDRVLPRDVPPHQLRLHMRVLLDEHCDQAMARRFCKALNGHVRRRLHDLHGLAPAHVLDSSTATYNQLVFVAPTFVPPLADPFAGGIRSGLQHGHPVPVRLCLEACLPGPPPPARHADPIPKALSPDRISRHCEARNAAVLQDGRRGLGGSPYPTPQQRLAMMSGSGQETVDTIPSPTREPEEGVPGDEDGQDDEAFDLEACDLMWDDMAAAGRQREFTNNPDTKAGRYRLFAGRALQDLECLVTARMGIPGSPWRHGIPKGRRTLSLLVLGTLARHAGQTPTQAVTLCGRWALTMVEGGGEAFHQQWRNEAEAQVRQSKAYPGKAGLLEMFDVGLDDQAMLTALVSDMVEARKLRQARAAQGMTARGTAPVVRVPQAQQAAAAGVSLSTWKRQQKARKEQDQKKRCFW